MSSDNRALYRLLDSSCEDMFLYFQELTWHLEGDVDALTAELNLLFANEAVGLSAKDEHEDGKELSEEEALVKEEKLKKFKELAKKNENYKKFFAKYGEKAASTLLGLCTMRFTGNPAGYGADDYVAIVGHLFTSQSVLQPILLSKYPKAAEVVNYIASKTATAAEAEKFRKIFAKTSEAIADSHRISSITQARYLNFTTEKDRENIGIAGVLGVIDPQFRSCFNPFFQEESQLPDLTPKTNADKPSKDDSQQRSLIERDTKTGVQVLVALKEQEFSGLDERDAAAKNSIALELAILKGDKTFPITQVASGEQKTQKVSTLIGFNSAKMAPAERLETVNNIEKLKDKQEKKLVDEARLWLQTRMEKLSRILEKKPHKPKALQEYARVSEARTLVEEQSSMFLRSPNPGPNGEAQFSPISGLEENGGKKQSRLKLFQMHVEKHKDVFSNKAISALTTFIDAIANFPIVNVRIGVMADVSPFGIKRSETSPNLNTPAQQLDRGHAKRRSQSSPNLNTLVQPLDREPSKLGSQSSPSPNTPSKNPSNSALVKLSKMSSAWFRKKCVSETITANEGVTPILSTSKGPGSTPGAPAA